MNKTAIKNFAVWARQKLISDITYKAGMLGVTEDGIAEKLPHSTPDLHFYDIGTKDYAEVSGKEIAQRSALVDEITKKAKENGDYPSAFRYVVEEVAYTWFNRLIAIRFMEVNDYLPAGVRVLSSENSAKKEPDLVTTPFDTDLEFTADEQDRIVQFKDENKLDELFRMLFIKQCNQLHSVLSQLFETTDDYSELLLTISFTDSDGVLYHLVHDIDEDDFNVEKEGQVQIIGWLYQFYNTELKDDTFAQLKKKVKITKERIPAATQLFTPDWIVRYMVENSLGRLWLEGHPNAKLHDRWKYYLDEARQEQSVEVQLQALRAEYKTIKPEEIKVIDPCMGSGHILVYAFDVLMQIYLECGYTEREVVSLILQNNLFGLDIDDRAYQLAYFAVMMKARQYDRRFLTRGIQPNLYSIRESNDIQAMTVEYFHKNDPKLKADMESIITEMRDAKEYGSILNITPVDFAGLYARFDEISNDFSMRRESVQNQLRPLVKCAEVLAQKYDVVVTNPPYMAVSNAGAKINDYVKKNFPDGKADMFAVFIERCGQMTKQNGYQAMITQHSWMFLSSFEKLRTKLLTADIVNMAHLGARAFEEIGGEVVQTTSFVIRKSRITDYKGEYCRLIEPTSQQGKEEMFLAGENRYAADQSNFSKIPGSPVAYWIGKNCISSFDVHRSMGNYASCKIGIQTGNNELFCRQWFEVNINGIFGVSGTGTKWFPYTKGGNYRKWYGNNDLLIDWENHGKRIKKFNSLQTVNETFWFQECITWGLVSSGIPNFRFVTDIFHVIGNGGPVANGQKNNMYLLALLNSAVGSYMCGLLNPTINLSTGIVSKIPVIESADMRKQIETLSEASISISKFDWNSYENSWDFKRNPLV